MHPASLAGCALALLLPASAARADEARGGGAASPRTEEVLGIFNRRCVECHGTAKSSAKLRLDTLDGVFKGGRSGPAVIAGKSQQSLIYQKVTGAAEIGGAEKRMPPKGEPLSEEETSTIRRWIESGARASASAASPRPAEQVPVSLKPLPAGFSPLFGLAGDPTGQRLAVGRGDTVEVLGIVEAGGEGKKPGVEVQASLGGQGDLVQALSFSPDGKLLAAGEFRRARVFSADGWKPLLALEPHADRVLALCFSPDSKRLLCGGGVPSESGELRLWDLETGSLLWSVSPHSDTVFGLAFSADGNTIVTAAADRTTYLIEAKTGKPLRRLEGHTHHVLAVALSPDGKRAASAGADKVLRLWDLEGGEPRSLRGHEGAVTSVQFIREGKTVISASGDGTVRLWNAGNGNQEGSLPESRGYLQAAAVFAGGKLYAAGEQDGAVRIYDLEKRRLLLTAEPVARP